MTQGRLSLKWESYHLLKRKENMNETAREQHVTYLKTVNCPPLLGSPHYRLSLYSFLFMMVTLEIDFYVLPSF